MNRVALAKRARRFKAASLVGFDEFSMIGRQMLGKVKYKVEEALGADLAGVRRVRRQQGRQGDPA